MTSCADALEQPRSKTPLGYPVLLVSAAALIDADGRVLVAQRPEGKWMAGLWEFPGGKLESGETPEFALCRELEEELGIETRECCFSPVGFGSHSYADKEIHVLMPLYACRFWKGTPTSKEGQNLKWVMPRDLYDLDMPPMDYPLIAQLLDRL